VSRTTEEREREQTIEARAFYLALPVLAPLIEKKQRVAHEKLMMAFRAGEKDLLPLIAELSSYDGIARELRQHEQEYLTLQERANESARR